MTKGFSARLHKKVALESSHNMETSPAMVVVTGAQFAN